MCIAETVVYPVNVDILAQVELGKPTVCLYIGSVIRSNVGLTDLLIIAILLHTLPIKHILLGLSDPPHIDKLLITDNALSTAVLTKPLLLEYVLRSSFVVEVPEVI